ncbi:retinoic acid early transcript 1E isoform X3 [Camelus dromedarius]
MRRRWKGDRKETKEAAKNQNKTKQNKNQRKLSRRLEETVTVLKLLGRMLPTSHATRLLLLILQLIKLDKTLGNAHSLCLDLTIKSQSRPGQPWCEVQGSVDTKPFLHYDTDSNEVKPLGLLGKEVTATKAWTELSQTLAEVGQELRMMLPVLKPHKNKTRGPPTLQAELCCRREAERCTGASWQFSIDGHTALLLDAMNMKWTVISPGDTGIEEWENDQGLAEYFRKTSVGDCNHWFQEFLEHWEERLEPEPTAPTLLSSDNEQSTDLQLMAWVIPSIFVSLVLIGITIRNYRRSRTTQG